MKKRDVGMAKHFSKCTETRDELSTTCNPKVMSRCLSAPDATSLPLTSNQLTLTLPWVKLASQARPFTHSLHWEEGLGTHYCASCSATSKGTGSQL